MFRYGPVLGPTLDVIARSREVPLDAGEAALQATALVPRFAQALLEAVHASAPLVPLLNAEQEGVDVRHDGVSNPDMNQPFGGAESPRKGGRFKLDEDTAGSGKGT